MFVAWFLDSSPYLFWFDIIPFINAMALFFRKNKDKWTQPAAPGEGAGCLAGYGDFKLNHHGMLGSGIYGIEEVGWAEPATMRTTGVSSINCRAVLRVFWRQHVLCVYTYIYKYTYVYIYIHVCIYIYTCVYIYIEIACIVCFSLF